MSLESMFFLMLILVLGMPVLLIGGALITGVILTRKGSAAKEAAEPGRLVKPEQEGLQNKSQS